MNKPRLGALVFWIGVVSVMGGNWLQSWFVQPYMRDHTPEQLSNTIWAADGFLFLFWCLVGPLGAAIALVGSLIIAQKKRSSPTWLLGPLAVFVYIVFIAAYSPVQHRPVFFGIGGGVIAISYLGIVWSWSKTHAMLQGLAKMGEYFKLLGYFFLMMASYAVCGYFGAERAAAFEYKPFTSSEAILISLSLGWLFLFIGHFQIVRAAVERSNLYKTINDGI